MNGPVVPTGFAELARPVEWVDDPAAVGLEATWVLAALLVENGIVGAEASELLGDEAVTDLVAGVHHVPVVGAVVPQLLTGLDE